MSEAAQAWSEIKDSKEIPVFEAFRKQFGPANTFYEKLAAKRIKELKDAKPEKRPWNPFENWE
ncbi:MAG: hypothetical protein ACLPPF_10960 [Rhodomicrobium sp.]